MLMILMPDTLLSSLIMLQPSLHADTAVNMLLLPGLVLIIGVFAGRLAVHCRLPRLTGYLLSGVALGPLTGVVSLQHASDLTLINELAIGVIALMAGAEIRLAWLRARARSILTITTALSLCVPLVLTLLLLSRVFLCLFIMGKCA